MSFWTNLSLDAREQIIVALVLLIVGGVLTKIGENVVWPTIKTIAQKVFDVIYPNITNIPFFRKFVLKKYFSALEKRANRLSNPWLPEDQKKLDDRYIPVRVIRREFLGDLEIGPDEGLTVELRESINSLQKLMILGEPGIGKSTALQSIVLDVIRNRITIPSPKVNSIHKMILQKFGRPLPRRSLVPIWIELKRFAAQEKSLLDYIEYLLATEYNFPNSRKFLQYLVEKKQIIFLFDALDEVGETSVNRVVNNILELFNKKDFSQNYILITCRSAAYRGELDSVTGNIVTIPHFRYNEIQNFLIKWPFTGVKSAIELLNTLKAKPQINALAQNPLLLTILTVLYIRNHRLPESRVTFYEICTKVFLEDWDQFRVGILRENKFESHEKQKILQKLAVYKQQKAGDDFSEDEIVKQIEIVLRESGSKSEEAKSILDELILNSGLIIRVGVNQYKFAHLTFQEYFTALEIEKSQGPDFLLKKSGNGKSKRWREVILLYCGMSSQASQVIDDLIQNDNIELASVCLSECREATNETAKYVINELEKKLNQNPENLLFEALARIASNRQEWSDRAFTILNQWLAKDLDRSIQIQLVSALARVNTHQAAQSLSNILSKPNTREAVLNALIDLGEVALPTLQKAINENFDDATEHAIYAIRSIGGIESIRFLCNQLFHNSHKIRCLSAIGIAEIIAREPLTEQLLNFESVYVQREVDISQEFIWPFSRENTSVNKIVPLVINVIEDNIDDLGTNDLEGIDARILIPLLLKLKKAHKLKKHKSIFANENLAQKIFLIIEKNRNVAKQFQSWLSLPMEINKTEGYVQLGILGNALISILVLVGGVGICAVIYRFFQIDSKFAEWAPMLSIGLGIVALVWFASFLLEPKQNGIGMKFFSSILAILGLGAVVVNQVMWGIPYFDKVVMVFIVIALLLIWNNPLYYRRKNIWVEFFEKYDEGKKILERIRLVQTYKAN